MVSKSPLERADLRDKLFMTRARLDGIDLSGSLRPPSFFYEFAPMTET